MIRRISLIIFTAVIAFGCKTYTSNLAFQGDEEYWPDSLTTISDSSNYLLGPGDLIKLQVFANNGELLIDPNRNFSKEFNINQGQQIRSQSYLIDKKGEALLPLIGTVKLAGLDLREAQDTLILLYDSTYVDPFVTLSVSNRRVTVFLSNTASVIPIMNENMTLIEVIGLAGGFPENSKAYQIKVLRGNLKSPFIQNIDLREISTISKFDLMIQPNDIVYVEPVRRPLKELLGDAGPIIGLATTIVALATIFSTR